jgi:hypothetical protein
MNKNTSVVLKCWCLALAAALLCRANVLFAQSSDEPTATVKVTPDRVAPGGSVTISGIAYVSNGLKLMITVTRPDGVKVTLGAVPDDQARYSTPYIGAPGPGQYTVSAQVGAKGAAATTHFKVESSAIDIDEDVADNQKFLDESRDLVRAVKGQVDNTPDSPAKTQVEAQLKQLEPAMQRLSEQSSQLTAMLAPVKSLLAEHPDTQPTLQPMLDHLDQLDQGARQAGDTVVKLTGDVQKTMQACDSIDQATQALQAVSQVLDLVRKPFEFVSDYVADMAKSKLPEESGEAVDAATKAVNLAQELAKANPQGKTAQKVEEGKEEAMSAAKGGIAENGIELGSESAIAEKLSEAIPESIRSSDGYKLAVASIRKFAPRVVSDAANPLKLFDDAAGLATDIATAAEQKLFARYCERFEGPFTATMAAFFYAKDHDQDWWHYTIAIKGTLTLRYPKNATGTNVPISGQFEGGATKFTYNESVWKNSDLYKIAGGSSGLVGTKDTAPIPVDSAKGGVLAALASPTSFLVPVTGHYANGRVNFKIADGGSDFDPIYVVGHTFYVVLSPFVMWIPVMNTFSLPYKDAHFLLGHFAFDYPVTQTGDSMRVETHEQPSFPRPGNKADYTFDLKLCNPACGGSQE